jgi:drug/metabolite transporter (DMT)-like permease
MRKFYAIGFLVLMVFDTLAQVCFKLAANLALPVEPSSDWVVRLFSHPYAYGAILGYIGAFFTWLTLLRHAPVGPAFAATHLQVISVLFVSAWLFHEPVTVLRAFGALLILAGILCLASAETSAKPPAPASTITPTAR